MSFSSWLRTLKARLQLPSGQRARLTRRKLRKHVALRVEELEDRTVLSTFTVTTTADNGDNNNPITGSLRWAINQVNADQTDSSANPDTIAFNITAASNAAGYPPGQAMGYNATTGVATIQPPSILPTIIEPVLLDGYSQPGASPNTNPMGGADPSDNAIRLIVLDGTQAPAVGQGNYDVGLLSITGANSTIRGLVVQYSDFPISILGSGATGNVIEGNYLELEGNYIKGRPYGIVIEGASNNTIGGTAPSARNILDSSNPLSFLSGAGSQIAIFGIPGYGVAKNNIVEGNYIGLNAQGSIVATQASTGILLDGAEYTQIGGTTEAERNVISGWDYDVFMTDNSNRGSSDTNLGNRIEGNYIGTDASGAAAVAAGTVFTNGGQVGLGDGNSSNNLISGNLISGNSGAALTLGNCSGDQIQNNRIGTDASGSNPLPNALGVEVDQVSTSVNVSGNTIAYNTGPAVSVLGTGIQIEGNSIYGNGGPAIDNLAQFGDNLGPPFIDTNAPGGPFTGTNSVSVSNLTLTQTQTQSGYLLTYNNGTLSGLPNTRYMVFLNVTSPDGSYFGSYYIYLNTDANGNASIMNLTFPAPSGINPIQGPVFPTTLGTWTAYAQAYPPHSQGNYEQNFPVLTSATSGSSTIVSGTLNGQANNTFTVDVYATNPNVITPSDFIQGQYYGEGQYFLGHISVTTDASGPTDVNGNPSGNASFTADFSTANLPGGTLPDGWYISTTATDPGGNTSQFSADVITAAAAAQTFSQYLQSALPTTQNPSAPTAISVQTGPDLTEDTVISAVNGLSVPSVPVTITLNLNGGTYDDTTVSPPHNVTLIINGASGTNTFVGQSPAFTVTGGNVIVRNVTFTTATDAPTILVTGGSLTLRNDVVQESTGYTDAAISITGGTLDLGTASDPGGNTLNVNGSGEFVHNTTANPISAVGDTFAVNGTAQTASTLSFTSLNASAPTALLHEPVTFTATVRPDGTGTPPGSVDFVDTTTNTDLGTIVLASNGTASITVSNLAAGAHVIQATYAGQGSFLGSSATLTQQVSYKFSGFQPPLGNGLTFAVNRTIPIKFMLTDYNGNAVTSLSAVTSLQIQALDANDNPVGAPFNPTSTNKQGLQYSGGQYQFNWQTKGLAAGSYEIVLKLADGTTQTRMIQLTAGGNSAGLVTDGSSGTASAGALLGGEVDLYVDNSNGDLTSDELARINDAVTSIDATIAPYGVTIVEVSEPTQANDTLTMNTTSSLGGLTQGVLGCTTDADQVTMIQGWDWYAGNDPTQVGTGQYDFETAVMHELGHVLGLGHSSDSSSVMYASLAAGTANRTLVTADLNVPDVDSGPCALHAAPAAAAGSSSNRPGMTVSSSAINSGSGGPMSAADQVLASLSLLLTDANNAYQSELSSVSALWQGVHALALQRLDSLLSLEAGAMGMSKDTLMNDLFFASLSSSNG